ncbi:nitroreductase family protein [Pseudodesulfovibrio indicus]|uniref:SagB-type dehydrogenase family enzyme n=1 Tax=Pseudodesulfovibrio indicus TaxID=1716143 RepID=A0AA94PXS7_9BACT|nr:SagB-type dehydrogenase family enzyme [Pseudodesulfovibrio indicus]
MPNLDSPRPRHSQRAFGKQKFNVVKKRYLPRPNVSCGESFWSVVENRRTRREFESISIDFLASLLWYSAHPRKVRKDEQGFETQFRPPPSAGGLHPIEILVVRPDDSGWLPYVYDPKAHCLCQIGVDDAKVSSFVYDVEDVIPIQNGTILWLAANFEKTRAKYHNADSLVWRDAGVLIGHMALVAEALSLSYCPLGITGEPMVSELLSSTGLVGVGGAVIGEQVP